MKTSTGKNGKSFYVESLESNVDKQNFTKWFVDIFSWVAS